MKHLKTFEHKDFKTFEKGDYVKCIDPDDSHTLTLNKIYIVKEFVSSHYNNFIKTTETYSEFFTSRFILATPENIEKYELEKNISRYNL
jgi:hypothetical protein